jgi:hypothetical protein
MRPRLITLFAVLFLLGAAGTALAVTNDGSYESTSSGEQNPACTGGAEESAITADTTPLRSLTGGDDSPVPDRELNVPLSFSIGDEKVFFVCSGEHWDSQDPNNRNSESDTDADEDDGDVYVNPLGDCSSYDGERPDGCDGGTDRPDGFTEPVDVRVTAGTDSPADGSDDVSATTYQNLEIFLVGRAATSVKADTGSEGGWVALYLEDHSDQLFGENGILGNFDQGDPLEHGEGNYLTIPFDPVLAGQAGEGDCTQDRYQTDRPCPRDNTAATVQYGYGWAPAPSNTIRGPSNLP